MPYSEKTSQMFSTTNMDMSVVNLFMLYVVETVGGQFGTEVNLAPRV